MSNETVNAAPPMVAAVIALEREAQQLLVDARTEVEKIKIDAERQRVEALEASKRRQDELTADAAAKAKAALAAELKKLDAEQAAALEALRRETPEQKAEVVDRILARLKESGA